MRKKIILISSDGGHLAQILELKELFLQYDYLIVTEKTEATQYLKEQYNVRYLSPRPQGKLRSIAFFLSIIKNAFLSISILYSHFPKAIITTGSHTAIPMCFLGKLSGVKLVWILSFARINSKAKAADLVYPFVDKFIVQWESAQKLYPKSIYLGGIY